MKYIYHHLGLGDHIICNGLVRTLITPNEEYSMFVKQHNLTSVKFMYRDLKNLNFIVGDDNFVKKFLHENLNSSDGLILAGFMRHPDSKEFDDSFYLQNNIPFINRWTKFLVNRDLESEKKIFKEFKVKENEYIFIHDDERYKINESKINSDLPIIRITKGITSNIFSMFLSNVFIFLFVIINYIQ